MSSIRLHVVLISIFFTLVFVYSNDPCMYNPGGVCCFVISIEICLSARCVPTRETENLPAAFICMQDCIFLLPPNSDVLVSQIADFCNIDKLSPNIVFITNKGLSSFSRLLLTTKLVPYLIQGMTVFKTSCSLPCVADDQHTPCNFTNFCFSLQLAIKVFPKQSESNMFYINRKAR